MKHTIRSAFQLTLPVLCGYLFIGIAFGVMLREVGYGAPWAFLCSLLIYAGSGQYLLVALIASGASLLTVAAMTLLLNCRHLFYGLTFLETFREMGPARPYMVFSLTDETYSLLCSLHTPDHVDPNALRLCIAILDHAYWIIGSVIGALLGAVLPFDATGIDFAMTALFVVLFLEQWMSSSEHRPALLGLVAAVGSLVLLGAERFLLPALLIICFGLFLLRDSIPEEVHP